MSSKRYSRDIKEISSDFPFPWGVSNANMVFCSRTLYPKQLRLCLSMLVGQCCLTIYLLNSFLCCHIIVIAPDLWDIIISFNTSLQKQALPAVRRALFSSVCCRPVRVSLVGPLDAHTQTACHTVSPKHTHTLTHPVQPRAGAAAERERANAFRKRTRNAVSAREWVRRRKRKWKKPSDKED